jgi:hypothetical protein
MTAAQTEIELNSQLYDYSNVPSFDSFDYFSFNTKVDIKTIIKFLFDNIKTQSPPSYEIGHPDKIDFINFPNLSENEKIIFHSQGMDDRSQGPWYNIFLTNYGNIMCYQTNGGGWQSLVFCKKYNFWLPTDYIKLLNRLFGKNMDLHIGKIEDCKINSIICHNILACVQNMKEFLYDRKIVPLYVKDIVDENNELKSKYDQYTNEKDQFEKEKMQFYNNEKPNLDIIKERKELNDLRIKLQLIAQKLKLEQDELDRQKNIINNVELEGFIM